MASIVVAGDTSGTVTLAAPSVAGTTTLTLPTANGTVITTGSSGQSIPKAALPTGSVLQVQQSTSTTSFSTSSSTLVDSGISGSFTPLYSSSKVLITVISTVNPSSQGAGFALYRGTTQIFSPMPNDGSGFYGVYQNIIAQTPLTYLDSPATTSSTTYRLYFASRSGTTSYIGGAITQFVFMEIAA